MTQLRDRVNLRRNALVVIGAAILGLAAFVRFYHLEQFGLYDSDAVAYSSVTKAWVFDNKFINPYAKPAYLLLGYLAVKLVGYYDFSLLYLNSFLDIVNILLMFVIGLQLGIRPILSLSACLCYAFLPYIIKEAARGLPHLSSATFFLAAFYVFLIYLRSRRKKKIHLFLAGFFSIFAGNVHPTLLCGAIFYFLVLLRTEIKRPIFSRENHEVLKSIFVYCWGGISVFLGLALIMTNKKDSFLSTLQQIFKKIFIHRQLGLQGNRGNVWQQIMHTFKISPEVFTMPLVILSSIIVALFIAIVIKKFILASLIQNKAAQGQGAIPKKKMLNSGLLWGVVVFFFLINFLTAKAWEYRLMIPSIPLIVLGVVGFVDMLADAYPRWRLSGIFLMIMAIMSAVHVSTSKALIMKTPTVYRQMANILADKVDAENRLLIAPSFLYRLYLEAVYFDGNNIYRIKGPWRPELEKLQRYNIRYVAVAKDLNIFYPLQQQDLAQLKAEYQFMFEGLRKMGAVCLYDSDKVAILEVPIETTANSWHRPPLGYPFFNVEKIYEVVEIKK